MTSQTSASPPARRRLPVFSGIFLTLVVFGCSAYANSSFLITNKANFRYLPPYKAYVNANGNKHLGGEHFQMAKALRAGEGFSHPFARPTGPTTWQPPVLPLILAGLLWVCDDSREGVTAVVVFLQDYILLGTTFLVLALVMQTTRRIAPALAAAACVGALLVDFRLYFQFTHDWWIVLLFVDLLIAGLCFARPMRGWKSATGWGLFGGLTMMVNPIAGLTWAILSTASAIRQRTWSQLGVAMLAAALTLTPWTVRNFWQFGRFIPSKGNLAFELYQSQCLQPSGLLLKFIGHPYPMTNAEGKAYKELGEARYLDRKWEEYKESIWKDPLDFLDRLAARFLGATLWYVPFHRGEGMRTWELWICRVVHPLPFLALIFLAYSAVWKPLHGSQWVVIGFYVFYLLPYIGASYYDRYAIPLLAPKILLVLWAAEGLSGVCWRSRSGIH